MCAYHACGVGGRERTYFGTGAAPVPVIVGFGMQGQCRDIPLAVHQDWNVFVSLLSQAHFPHRTRQMRKKVSKPTFDFELVFDEEESPAKRLKGMHSQIHPTRAERAARFGKFQVDLHLSDDEFISSQSENVMPSRRSKRKAAAERPKTEDKMVQAIEYAAVAGVQRVCSCFIIVPPLCADSYVPAHLRR